MLLLNLKEVSSSSVFVPEQIIIPSAAVKRRLTLAIADIFGVCTNVEFSFLAHWLWQQVGQLVPVQKTSPFSSTVLVWRVLRLLEEPDFAKPFPRLAAYLSCCDEVMRYDFSARVAALLEQYVIYRPEWLTAWSKGEMVQVVQNDNDNRAAADADQAWQAAVWRRIAEETGTLKEHPAELFFKALETDGEKAASVLPERIHLFCEPSVAPQYIEMLRHLARWIDIELYVLNPCREFWFEIVDLKRLAYLVQRKKDLCHETGNRLLASWGKQCQASLDCLLSRLEPVNHENDFFISNAEFGEQNTMLSHVQDAILDLTELSPGSLSRLKADESIEIHVAHSLRREIEILYDQLLLRLTSDNPPDPERMLVVMPDLDAAAPMIEAVFGHNGSGTRIPYVITGRKDSRINPVSRALLDLLALASSRFSAADVMDVLMLPVVGQTFGFDDDLTKLRRWLKDAGICWAMSGEHKTDFELPPEDDHSFQDGLHRLFLAYALPDSEQTPFANRLAAGNPVGSQSLDLGRIWQFIQKIKRLKIKLSQPKTADGWRQAWFGILEDFLTLTPDLIDSEGEVRACIQELYTNMSAGDPDFRISFPVARHALERALEGAGQGSVPAGSLVFAPMDSLRTLPFEHIFMIGLDDSAFPSDRRGEEFDLIQLSRRKTDRQERDEDRNVFLDLLLSARKSLYLSYSGRNGRDNSIKPPSVLVSELLESLLPVLADGNDLPSRESACKTLVIEHPLQAFSADYFNGEGDPRRVSFRADLCEALEKKRTSGQDMVAMAKAWVQHNEAEDKATVEETQGEPAGWPFISLLRTPDEFWQDVSLSQLIRFFNHPARFLLTQRLGVDFSRVEEELPSNEPFMPDRQKRRDLAKRLLPLYLDGKGYDEIRAAALAGNEFPAGRIGKVLLEQELMELSVFAKGVLNEFSVPRADPVSGNFQFDLECERWQLSGSLPELRLNGLLRYRYDEGSARDYLSGWIEHVFLNASAPAGVGRESIWYFKNERFHLVPCENAQTILADLLTIYREGLTKPLHFFPRSSWELIREGGNIKKAAGKWKNTQNQDWSESADPFNRLLMRGVDNPLDEAFIDLSTRIFNPLLDCLRKGFYENGQ